MISAAAGASKVQQCPTRTPASGIRNFATSYPYRPGPPLGVADRSIKICADLLGSGLFQPQLQKRSAISGRLWNRVVVVKQLIRDRARTSARQENRPIRGDRTGGIFGLPAPTVHLATQRCHRQSCAKGLARSVATISSRLPVTFRRPEANFLPTAGQLRCLGEPISRPWGATAGAAARMGSFHHSRKEDIRTLVDRDRPEGRLRLWIDSGIDLTLTSRRRHGAGRATAYGTI
jgi:hypothetical protein